MSRTAAPKANSTAAEGEGAPVSRLTRTLGAFVGDTRVTAPAQALEIAKRGILDTAATTIAGAGLPAAQTLLRVLAPQGGPAGLLFGAGRADAPTAALINGTAAHVLDYDDVAMTSHPSAVLASALLAEAQSIGASGQQILDAYAVGFEVWAELAFRERGALHLKGWHPTGVWGAVGAAAACARLLRLDATQAASALGLAASQSGGLMANFGSMTKAFHAGRAAQSGLLSARLAQQGFTSAPDALEHEQGLLRAVSEAGDTDRTSPFVLQAQWQIQREGLSIKKFPTCYATHRAIDAMLQLVRSRPLQGDDIDHITVVTNARYAKVLRNAMPETGLAAKFSMQFAIACPIVAGRVGLAELQDSFVNRPDVRSLMAKVRVDPSQGHTNTPGSYEQAQIVLKSGECILTDKVLVPRGHASLPLDDAEIRVKFEDCLGWSGREDDAQRIYRALAQLEVLTAKELAPECFAGRQGGRK